MAQHLLAKPHWRLRIDEKFFRGGCFPNFARCAIRRPPTRVFQKVLECGWGRKRLNNFYIEFEIADDEQFRKLSEVFAALLTAKNSDDWKDDAFWLSFFNDDSKAHFWWPTEEEIKDWEQRWFSTPPEMRLSDPSLRHNWHFGSMIDAFRHSDNALLECRRTSDGRARIEFDPYGHPYGGTECMRVLVESFGHRVVEVRD